MLLALAFAGCSPGSQLGESWYVGEGSNWSPVIEANLRSNLQLIRKTGRGRVVVARAIRQPKFIAPDCVVYETGRRIYAVCGDRLPLAIGGAFDQWEHSDQGPTWVNPPYLEDGRLLERVQWLPLDTALKLAQAQPPFRERAVEPSGYPLEPAFLDRPPDVNKAEYYQRTPIFEAVQFDRKDLVQALIIAGANVSHADTSGFTPLMMAAANVRSDGEVLDMLIRAGAQLDAQNYQGLTALMIAAGSAERVLVEKLVAAGANATLRDRAGRTARESIPPSSNRAQLEQLLRAAEQRQ